MARPSDYRTIRSMDRMGCGQIVVGILAFVATAACLILMLVGTISLLGPIPFIQPMDLGPGGGQPAGGNQAPGGGQPGVGAVGTLSSPALHAALEDLPDSFIVGGSATTSVSGGFTLSQQISADDVRSYIQDGMAWLGFGDLAGGTGAAEILIALNESGDDSVTVAQGPLAAIGRNDDCEWNIEVSASTISGTVSCAAAEVWRDTTEPTGTTASIQLQFSTTLTPMEE